MVSYFFKFVSGTFQKGMDAENVSGVFGALHCESAGDERMDGCHRGGWF